MYMENESASYNQPEVVQKPWDKDEDECCVCINIITSDGKKYDPCGDYKKDDDKKKCCVCVNIFCDCEKKHKTC